MSTPFTAASMYRAWLSAGSPGSARRVITGVAFRARMATPFQLRWPCHTAPYPAASMSAVGKSPSSHFSSCRHTTSGRSSSNQFSRLASRLLTLLMLKVAIRTCLPRPRLCQGA